MGVVSAAQLPAGDGHRVKISSHALIMIQQYNDFKPLGAINLGVLPPRDPELAAGPILNPCRHAALSVF